MTSQLQIEYAHVNTRNKQTYTFLRLYKQHNTYRSEKNSIYFCMTCFLNIYNITQLVNSIFFEGQNNYNFKIAKLGPNFFLRTFQISNKK